jgi:hypothetical protein
LGIGEYDAARSGFLWSGQKDKKKIPLSEMKNGLFTKDHGGLGVIGLEVMDIELLSKWLWKNFNGKG